MDRSEDQGADPQATPRRRSTDIPSRAARRRQITRSLISASTAADPRRNLFHFDRELAEQYARNRGSSFVAIAVLILIMGTAAAILGQALPAVCWVGAMLLTHTLSLLACKRFLREGTDRRNLYSWKRGFIIRELLYGVCWSIFPILIPTGDEAIVIAGLGIIKLAGVIVVLSVGALLSSPIPAAAVAGTLPIALSMALAHILPPTFFNVTVAVCTLAAEILFLHLTSHLYNQTAQSIAYRAEKDAMFAELEQAKAISDEARRRAEASNRAKSQFLATMSHELRTPLNAILGFSDIMRTELLGKIDNDSYKSYLDDIHSSGQHLLRIINEILDLSRIEAGKRELREELVSLVAIAAEAVSLLQLKAREKAISVEEIYDEDLSKVIVDEQALRQVVLNLLSNALKFTPKEGSIVVKVGRTQAGGQYVSVRDNGPGIPEDEIPLVLSAFGQSSVSIKTAEQGTGLGIPIVQALIRLHGGHFTLRSKLGIGTEAIATLPPKRVVSPFAQDKGPREVREHREPRRRVEEFRKIA